MKKDGAQEPKELVRYDERGVFEVVAPHLLDVVTGADSSLVAVGVNSACELPRSDSACISVNQVCEGAISRNGVCAGVNQSCIQRPDEAWNSWCLNQVCAAPQP